MFPCNSQLRGHGFIDCIHGQNSVYMFPCTSIPSQSKLSARAGLAGREEGPKAYPRQPFTPAQKYHRAHTPRSQRCGLRRCQAKHLRSKATATSTLDDETPSNEAIPGRGDGCRTHPRTTANSRRHGGGTPPHCPKASVWPMPTRMISMPPWIGCSSGSSNAREKTGWTTPQKRRLGALRSQLQLL